MTTMTTDHPRVVIVTGGSGGIGGEVAQRLARDGMSVVVAYAGRKGPAEEIVTAIIKAGGTATAFQGDVAEEADVAALFDAAELNYGGVDVVVNAAGIMQLSPIIDLDMEVFDRIVHINLRGTFLVDREAARRVRPGGAIINFSSSVQKIARPGYTAYAATKGAVDAITLILAKELRGRDVTVNSVAPGPTATPLFLNGKDQESLDRMSAEAPLERLGTPADIAEVVAFLAGPARWVNGQVIYPNGGVV
jgi:3-oxoacyl-[acyl-carrier protein] reductase